MMKCEKCRDSGFVRGTLVREEISYDVVRHCRCEIGHREYRKLHGIGHHEKPSLERYIHQVEAIKKLQESYKPENWQGVMLYGNTGTGKTLFMKRARSHWEEKNIKSEFYSWDDVVKMVQDGFKSDSLDQTTTRIVSALSDVPVLFLDDLGAGGSENINFLERVFGKLLNNRIALKRKTYVSTNFSPYNDQLGQKIGERLASRLFELCAIADMIGPDLRREKAGVSDSKITPFRPSKKI